jgi:hypothetical protein
VEEVQVLPPQGPVQAQHPARVSDLLVGGALIDEKRGRVTGEANQEEHDGDDTPDDKDGVDEATKDEGPYALRHLLRATPRKSIFSSGSGTKRRTRAL